MRANCELSLQNASSFILGINQSFCVGNTKRILMLFVKLIKSTIKTE